MRFAYILLLCFCFNLLNSQGYIHDDFNRLVRHESESGIIEYSYNAVGNRIQYQILSNQGLSDLHPSNLILSSVTPSPGSTISLTFTLVNLGEGTAGLHQQKVYISTTQSITGATELLEFYISSVAGMDSVILTENITIPNSFAPGTYYILVNTDDAEQVEETDEGNNLAFVQIALLNCPPMTITFPVVINEACGNGEGSITAEASGGMSPYEYIWNTVPLQTGATAIHLTAGTYTVTATDEMGCMESESQSIINDGEIPTANYSFIVDDLTVSFTSTSVGADMYFWDFGDGQTSTLENPVHVYAIPGAFYPCLEVTNGCGDNSYCQLVEPESDGCFPPINLNTGTLGVTSATLEWWPVVFVDHYEVRYRPVGSTDWIVIPTTNDLNWFVIYGLGANTEYEWQVRTFCDGGGVSPWSASHFFMTFPVSSENADEFMIVADDTITAIEYRTVGSTNDGGYLAAGPQGNNLIVDRYSQSGVHLWRQRLNSGGQATGILELANGDIVIVGRRNGDAMVVKFNGSGSYVWTRLLGGAEDDLADAIQQDGDGNLVIAGWTESYGAGGFEAWLFKMDLNGAHLWSRFFGDSEYTLGGDIEIANDGNYVMVMRQRIIVSGTNRRGFALVKVSPNGNVIWTKSHIPGPLESTYYLDKISEDSEGNLYVSGGSYAKLSNSGNLLWIKTVPTAEQLVIDSLDNIFLIGDHINSTLNGQEIHIVQINNSGDVIQSKIIHSDASYNSVYTYDAVAKDDYLVITGYTRGFSPGNEADKGIIIIKNSNLLDDCYMVPTTYENESLSLSAGTLSLSSSVSPTIQMPSDTWVAAPAITLYPCGSPCGILAQISVAQDTFCANSMLTFYNISDGADGYEWSIDSFSNIVDTSVHLNYHFLTSGVYTINLVAYNDLGCNDTVQMTMTILDNPFISLITQNASCGEMNGSAEVNITLGISPFTHLWSTGDTSTLIADLAPGVYAISVYDAFGCFSSETFQILDSTAGCELPDLILSNVFITPDNSISADIVNQGSSIAVFENNIFLDAYISSDSILDEGTDIGAGAWILDGLLSSLEPDSSFTWEWGDISGTDICEYPYLIVRVDRNNEMEESNESNNTTLIFLDPSVVCGCTDSLAHNFDQSATHNNGSCETCTDGIQNGDETDIDCGGLLCPTCDSSSFQVIYTSPGLYGITNAVVYNGEVHFVAGLDPTGNFPGYPDPNSKFVKLFLITESDTAYQYESASSASYPYDGNLKRTSDGKLAFSYQAPSGSSYGFRMPYKVVDTSGLLLNELVFSNQNWGAWGRMFFDSIGEPNIVSFAHAGYILKEHKRDSGAWLTTNISGTGTYMAHLSHAMYGDVKYILLRYGTSTHSLRLYYTNNAGVWLNETIKSNISNSCDIEISKDGQIHVLFEDDGYLQLGVKNNTTWVFDSIVQVSNVYHNATLYFDCMNNLYVAYQEPNRITVMRKEGGQWQEVYEHHNISSPEGTFQPSIVSKGEELLVIYNDTSNVYQAFIGPEYCCSMVNTEIDDYVPGTLRYAVDCAESGDTIVFAPELTGDTIVLSNGYLTLGKELSFIVPDSITLFVKGEMDGFMIHITPSGNVVIDRLNLLHTGDIMSESIKNEGILVMKNLDIITNNTSPEIQAIIQNMGSIIIQGQVRIFSD